MSNGEDEERSKLEEFVLVMLNLRYMLDSQVELEFRGEFKYMEAWRLVQHRISSHRA